MQTKANKLKSQQSSPNLIIGNDIYKRVWTLLTRRVADDRCQRHLLDGYSEFPVSMPAILPMLTLITRRPQFGRTAMYDIVGATS